MSHSAPDISEMNAMHVFRLIPTVLLLCLSPLAQAADADSAPAIAFGGKSNPAIQVTPLLKTTTAWDGQAITYPTGQAEITGMIVEIAPGAETGWHQHPVPSFGLIMQGEILVELKNGQSKLMHTGEMVAEVANTLHNGKNIGTIPVRIAVFYAGAKGMPLTVMPQKIANVRSDP